MLPFDPANYTMAAMASWFIGLGLFAAGQRYVVLRVAAHVFYLAGVLVLVVLAAQLWQAMGRAPMRTLGETRLWYGLFLPLIGYAVYVRWGYAWMLYYAALVAAVFLGINLLHPENYDRDLMPALQSPWFVPHVIVYIFAYAVLAASAIVAVKGLILHYVKRDELKELHLADNLVYIGFGFLTLGLLFGALWGKEAWGHYWTWDPKETWAFLTWIVYLAYMHHRIQRTSKVVSSLWILAVAFVVLLVCWYGVNYLPSAANSVHTYTR